MLSAHALTSTVPAPESSMVSPISLPSTVKPIIGPPLMNVLPFAALRHHDSYVNSSSSGMLTYARCPPIGTELFILSVPLTMGRRYPQFRYP